LLAQPVPVEIIVVDNASIDNSVVELRRQFRFEPRLCIVENSRNLGFSKAVNLGLARSSSEFALIMNPDCIVQRDAIRRVLAVLRKHPESGMAGCLIRNPDGTEQAGCRRSVPTPWRSLVRVLHLNRLYPNNPRFRTFLLNHEPLPTRPVEVEAISGAFMLVRRNAMEQVGFLDEEYFLHCDDLDWCLRFRRQGWTILFVPDAEAMHYQGTCSEGRPIRVEWYKHKGMMRFYRKFFRHQYSTPLMWLVSVAVWTRFGLLASRVLFLRTLNRRQQLYKSSHRMGSDAPQAQLNLEPEVPDSSFARVHSSNTARAVKQHDSPVSVHIH